MSENPETGMELVSSDPMIAVRDAAGETILLNLSSVVYVGWVQRAAKTKDGKTVPLAGTRTLAVATTELHQASTINRYLHPQDADRLWKWFLARATDLTGVSPEEPGGNGDHAAANEDAGGPRIARPKAWPDAVRRPS